MVRRQDKNEIEKSRRDVVRLFLAREMYDHEIVDACQKHPLFRFKNASQKHRVLSRSSIRKCYLYKVREELRKRAFDGEFEMMRAYERLMSAYRLAVEKGDPKAMVMTQKAVNKMLGLRRDPEQMAGVNAEKLREQLQEIHDSIGGK